MKRTAIILLLTLFSVALSSTRYSAPLVAEEAQEPVTCSIEDCRRIDIAALADILHDCRFELPQSTRTQCQRHDEQPSLRRPSINNKATEAASTSRLHQKHPNTFHDSLKAVAAARHNRGYYIYTLRHIII